MKLKIINKFIAILISIIFISPVGAISIFGKIKNHFKERSSRPLTKQQSVIIHDENDKLGEKFNIMINGENAEINHVKDIKELTNCVIEALNESGDINGQVMGKITLVQKNIIAGTNPMAKEGLLFINLLLHLTELSDLIRHGQVSPNGISTLKEFGGPLLDLIDKWEETGNLSWDIDELRGLIGIEKKH